jgi:hypothetical protein
MIDKEQAQHITDVAGECNRLNEISQRVTPKSTTAARPQSAGN